MAQRSVWKNPAVITAMIVGGAVVLAWVGLGGGWLKTQALPTSGPSILPKTTEPVSNPPTTVPSPMTSKPIILGITPSKVIAAPEATEPVQVTVAGSRFVNGCVVMALPNSITGSGVELVTACTSATEATATIPPTVLRRAGIFYLRVRNPNMGDFSNAVSFTVENPAPKISKIEPNRLPRGPGVETLNITGEGFNDYTQITINNQVVLRNVISPTEIRLNTLHNNPGNYQFRAYNGPPGGGTSAPVIVTVTAQQAS